MTHDAHQRFRSCPRRDDTAVSTRSGSCVLFLLLLRSLCSLRLSDIYVLSATLPSSPFNFELSTLNSLLCRSRRSRGTAIPGCARQSLLVARQFLRLSDGTNWILLFCEAYGLSLETHIFRAARSFLELCPFTLRHRRPPAGSGRRSAFSRFQARHGCRFHCCRR